LPLIDVFLPNEVEAMAISNTDSVDKALEYFASCVSTLTVVKMGDQGAKAVISKTKETVHHPTFRATVIDVTGAGDSFNAGFLYSWTKDRNVLNGLKWGCAVASKCVASLGACSQLTPYQDIEDLVQDM